MSCDIIEKKVKKIEIRLFDEEVDIADFLCFLNNLSYEQLFVKLNKESAERIARGEDWIIMSELIEKQERLLSILENPHDKMIVRQYIEKLKNNLKELSVNVWYGKQEKEKDFIWF